MCLNFEGDFLRTGFHGKTWVSLLFFLNSKRIYVVVRHFCHNSVYINVILNFCLFQEKFSLGKNIGEYVNGLHHPVIPRVLMVANCGIDAAFVCFLICILSLCLDYTYLLIYNILIMIFKLLYVIIFKHENETRMFFRYG